MSASNNQNRVIIDVDGVLRDFIGSLTRVYLREYPDHSVKPVTTRRLEDFYPIREKIYQFMDATFAHEILENAPATPGAIESLKKWESEFDIVIATTQPPGGRFPTFVWLGAHKVPTNEIHITAQKQRLPGIALLDDFIDNLERFEATDRLAVCFDQPWNQEWKGPRVKTVDEFFEYITRHLKETDRDSGVLFA